MDEMYVVALELLAALAIGLLIGIERGWSNRKEDEGQRVAGIRTFSLIGLLGGVIALLSQEIGHWLLMVGFVSVSALVIAAHILEFKKDKDVGTTTAFGMILTFSLAAWAAYGNQIPAIAVTVITMFILGHKLTLHQWLTRVSPEDFFSGVKLLLISVVLLPLLPDKGFGPWEALNPYWTWWMVVLISGLSFLGYIVIKMAGDRMGMIVTAVAGGLVSSTAVTLSLARFARNKEVSLIFSGGVLIASSIMFVRVMIEVFVVHTALLRLLWLPLTAMLLGLLASLIWIWRQNGKNGKEQDQRLELKNPLQLGMALQFGLLLAVILVLSEAMKHWFGNQGVYILSVISGLMDVDAITLSLSRSAHASLEGEVAITGIVLACATNTLFKGILFAWIAGFRKNIHVPLLMLAAMVPGVVIALA
ncbi:MgtC/SapB family protein [Desulfoplanes sp. PS50]